IGWLAIASGLIPLLTYGSFANIWNLLIGWFLLQNANRVAQSATVQERLNNLTVADAVTPDSPVVSASLSLRDFADTSILGNNQWRRFLVVDDAGQLVGAIALDDVRKVSTAMWTETQVKDLMQPIETSAVVRSNQSLLEAAMVLEQQQRSALPVVRENGVLIGILEKAAILQLLQKRMQANPA
ncbi:MAG TPA: site-2 protease family protein, partial [Cyanobacteria bacterium UBA11049]|nr:site-2 protease family protein [Cyanobacteria bacterium UBA11049]